MADLKNNKSQQKPSEASLKAPKLKIANYKGL